MSQKLTEVHLKNAIFLYSPNSTDSFIPQISGTPVYILLLYFFFFNVVYCFCLNILQRIFMNNFVFVCYLELVINNISLSSHDQVSMNS